jgi:hypothetical protein
LREKKRSCNVVAQVIRLSTRDQAARLGHTGDKLQHFDTTISVALVQEEDGTSCRLWKWSSLSHESDITS